MQTIKQPIFRIGMQIDEMKELNAWLADNNITEYEIIELFGYLAFAHEKDAVLFRLSHDNEIVN